MVLNPELIKLARYSISKSKGPKSYFDKLAFQPPTDPSQDPSQQGMPPGAPPGMDPSMMGGMPPGAPPGMDPSMQGAPPGMDPSQGMPPMPPPGAGAPMDPSMGGAGAVPGAGGLTADSIRQIMQEILGQMGMVPGQSGPGGGAAGGKPGKPDLMAMSNDIFQIKKILLTIMNAMDIPMPQDILDGPNRDPATGMPMPPNAPGSTSDPNRVSPPAGGPPGGGSDSAIKPIQSMQGAFPASPGGGMGGGMGGSAPTGEKPASVRNKAAALATVLRRKGKLTNVRGIA